MIKLMAANWALESEISSSYKENACWEIKKNKVHIGGEYVDRLHT